MPTDRNIAATSDDEVVTTVIKIDDAEIPNTIQIDTIAVTKEVNRISAAKVVILDGDSAEEQFSASNGQLFIPGKEIEILCGYKSDNHTLFKGIIIKQSVKIRSSGGSILIVECRDKAIQMTLGRKNMYFVNKKDSNIINEILGTYHGLTVDIETTNVLHKRIVQYQSTDWDFMLSRADVNGKICTNDDGKITIKAPILRQTSVVSLLFGATILELDAEIDARYQLKAIKSQSWSHSDQTIIESDAINPSVSLNGNLTPDQLSDVGGLTTYNLNHGGNIPESELRNWGNAMWLKHQLAKVRGRVRFKGIHTIKPGMIVNLGGISDRFNGNSFVSGVHHSIAAGNWQVDAQLGMDPEWFSNKPDFTNKPASGLLPAIHGLQIGIVTQLENDPDNECRIQVRLPIISANDDGTWARVCTLDAGNERGSFFLPEVGDEVIVGFLNDDPREAVVLGMLNSSAKTAPLTAADDNNEKGFVTRSKMKMIFNDEKKSFTLETPAGKKLILDEDAGILKLDDGNGNTIKMDTQGITIESGTSITIKAGTNLTLEAANLSLSANAGLKIKGSGSSEISSSGSLTLKGAIVQIN